MKRRTAPVSQGPSLSTAATAELVKTRFPGTAALSANVYSAVQYRNIDNTRTTMAGSRSSASRFFQSQFQSPASCY